MKPLTKIQKGLLVFLGLPVLAVHVSAFAAGFYPALSVLMMATLICGVWTMVLALLYAAVTAVMFAVMFAVMIFRKTAFLKFVLLWPCLCVLGLPSPLLHLTASAGAISRVEIVGPERVIQEGRQLLAGDYKEPENESLFGNERDIKPLPPAIAKLNSVFVRRYGNHLLIKMYGSREYLGFVVVRDNSVPSEDKFDRMYRITDGLYWAVCFPRGI